LCAYFLVVLLPLHIVVSYRGPMIVCLVFVAIHCLLRRLARHRVVTEHGLKSLILASVSALISILALDTGYAVYLNKTAGLDPHHDVYRLTDREIIASEVEPPKYFPTDQTFYLLKPNVSRSALVYGRWYYTGLLDIGLVANSVLERRRASFFIDQHGFRDTDRLEEARIFALGDSFVFGDLIEQDLTWPEQLQHLMKTPVYNLGLNATSPGQQVLLVEYLLRTKPDSFRPRQILWMMFEANDLEDSFDKVRPLEGALSADLGDTAVGDVFRTLIALPRRIREQAVIDQFRTGSVSFRFAPGASGTGDPYLVDGKRLRIPLYRSARFGPRLFGPDYIDRATKPESYIQNHPNWPHLVAALRDMALLSKKHGFEVTTVIAPSAARLYAAHFENFPRIPTESSFARLVGGAARDMGFRVVDLTQEMRPYAEKELLYFRDDTHWNARGNAVVAEILGQHL
jgi:hypothetical protein